MSPWSPAPVGAQQPDHFTAAHLGSVIGAAILPLAVGLANPLTTAMSSLRIDQPASMLSRFFRAPASGFPDYLAVVVLCVLGAMASWINARASGRSLQRFCRAAGIRRVSYCTNRDTE